MNDRDASRWSTEAQWDQVRATMANTAKLLGGYYAALTDEGIPDQLAGELVYGLAEDLCAVMLGLHRENCA